MGPIEERAPMKSSRALSTRWWAVICGSLIVALSVLVGTSLLQRSPLNVGLLGVRPTVRIGNDDYKMNDLVAGEPLTPSALAAGRSTICADDPRGNADIELEVDGVRHSDCYTIANLGPELAVEIYASGHRKGSFQVRTRPDQLPAVNFVAVKQDDARAVLSDGTLMTDYLQVGAPDAPGMVAEYDMDGALLSYAMSDRILMNFRSFYSDAGDRRYAYFRELPNSGTPSAYPRGEIVIADESMIPLETIRPVKTALYQPENAMVEAHDFLFLGDNHYLLMDYYPVPLVNKGEDVSALYIQEQRNGEVVWEWISTSVEPKKLGVSSPQDEIKGDYIHANSLAIDPCDGNIVVSLRATSTVISLNKTTGAIDWSLGSTDESLSFVNSDPAASQGSEFAFQHNAVARCMDGTRVIQVYDNGDYQGGSELTSSGRIYQIDLDRREATEIERVGSDINRGRLTGSFQTFDAGYLIGWGMIKERPQLATVFNKDGEPILEAVPEGFMPVETYRWYFDSSRIGGVGSVTPNQS